ncbi:hypothetical protein NWF32_22910 [Pseudomonas qingdaonensis]|nr:hypothetical protein [Pseudomonas qingdaonensis]
MLQLIAVGQVDLGGAAAAVLARVIAVGLEHIHVGELLAQGVAAHMGKLDNVLGYVLALARVREMAAVAIADKGIAEGWRRASHHHRGHEKRERGRADASLHQGSSYQVGVGFWSQVAAQAMPQQVQGGGHVSAFFIFFDKQQFMSKY